jgi:hypothetical protein
VLELKKHLVDTVLETQEPDGYIGMLAPPSRMRGLWDVHEIGYLIWGLLTDEAYHGEARSLAAARKAADYLLAHWSEVPENWVGTTGVATHVAVTGLERTMLALHRRTGDPAYLDFVVSRRALPRWDLGIVVGRREGIEGHVYAYMARCLAQIELNRMRPGAQLLRPAQRAIGFMLDHDGALITGATGQAEIWTDDQDGRGDLGETCATAYQLRVADALLRLDGQARLGDLIERTIFNALFAAQSPDGRQLRYFAPIEGPRVIFSLNPASHPELAKQDAADLGAFLLDPSSLGDPVPGTTVRPDGLACRVRFWPPGFGTGRPSEKQVEWTLTEFSDPAGRAAYFRLRDARAAVDDELFNRVSSLSSLPRP